MNPVAWLVLAGDLAAVHMTLVVWIVQLRLYPAFRDVGEARWAGWHRRHSRRLGWLAGPPMILELAGAAAAVVATGVADPLMMGRSLPLAGLLLGLTLGTWILTFGVAVPFHRRLEAGWDRSLVEALIRWNWPRTVLWTVKTGVLLGLVLSGLR